MTTVSSGNIMNFNGLYLSNFMIDGYKYNICAVSKPYNKRGAYHRLENNDIHKNNELYNLLSDNSKTIAESFVKYYNEDISITDKTTYGIPVSITENDIESICVTRIYIDYTELWNR